MKRWTIYCHTHIESGRRYIGLTSKTMLARWNDHAYKAHSSKGGRWHFPNAIRKYGKDAFKNEVLETCTDLEQANEREKYWINHFDTRNPLKGFNLASGGLHVPHPIRKNPWDRPEYRAKMILRIIAWTNTPQARANNKAALNTPESRAKRSALSKTMIESRPELKIDTSGRPLSLEHRQKISEANKRRDINILNRFIYSGLGRSPSSETRAKLAVTSAGRVKSPEELAKISAAASGRKHSPEHLAKIAEKRKIRDAARIINRTHFDCRTHGAISLADCYRKQVRDHARYECRQCRKALRHAMLV